jgi:predicted DNA-binding transcriptional regulator AlpA
MSHITVIPTPLAQAHALRIRNPRNAGTVDLFHVAGRLGQAHISLKRLVRLIDAMIEQDGFPPALPHLSGGRKIRTASRDAAWPEAAVDHWFEKDLPADLRHVLGGAERHAIDSRLSAAAMQLFDGDAA